MYVIGSVLAIMALAVVVFVRHRKEERRQSPPNARSDKMKGAYQPFVASDEPQIVKTAYHEAGHALLAWQSRSVMRFTDIRIDDDGGHVNHRRIASDTEAALWERLLIKLGGIAGEVVACGRFRSGYAASDLQEARAVAETLVAKHGIKEIGRRRKSLKTDSKIDIGATFARRPSADACLLLNTAFCAAKERLIEFRAPFRRIAEALIEKRRLDHADLVSLLGPRPWA